MRHKPNSCSGCPLEKLGTGFIVPEGKGASGVMLVGEFPGKNEIKDGLPFRPYAESGSYLEKVFRVVKKERQDFRITNVVGCRPPGDILHGAWYEDKAIGHCFQYLESAIGLYKPKAILALGNVALKTLTGIDGITKHRGYAWNTKWGYVVAGLHPSFIRRGKSQLLPTLVYDLQKALRIAYGSFTDFEGHPSYTKPDYNVTPGINDALSFRNRVRDNQGLVLCYDIENPNSAEAEENEREKLEYDELVQIQFSLGKREGIAFPWQEPYIGIAKEILSYQNVKLGHNIWFYDNPVIKELHDIVPNGITHDTLAMFHHMHPDLEAGLQKAASLFDFPFPWKHLAGSDLSYYGCADVDSVHWIWDALPDQMKARGVWDGYIKQVQGFYPILIRAQERGVGVNAEYREEFKILLEKKRDEAETELNKVVPTEILNPHPKKGYKQVPWEVQEKIDRYNHFKTLFEAEGKAMLTSLEDYIRKETGYEEREFEVKENELGRVERSKRDTDGSFDFEYSTSDNDTSTMVGDRQHKENSREVGDNEAEGLDEEVLDAEDIEEHRETETEDTEGAGTSLQNGNGVSSCVPETLRVTRWCRIKPFSARSSQQVVRYIRYRARHDPKGTKRSKHIVPLTLRDEKETTAKEELERLYFNTGDVGYKLIVLYREFAKILSNDIPMWTPNPKTGRVHTKFTMSPASGQLSSRNPNIQNCFSPDTEILTKRGWVRFDNLISSDSVAQYWLNGSIEFVDKYTFIKQEYCGDLCFISTDKQIRMLTTPDHLCLLRDARSINWYKVEAKDYPNTNYIQMCAGSYTEGSTSLSNYKVSLICALQADGHIDTGGAIRFKFSKQRKINRCRLALDAEGINYNVYIGEYVEMYIPRVDIPTWLYDKKLFGPWLLDMSSDTLCMFREEMFFWDGSHKDRSKFASTIESNADWVQIVQVLSGRRAKIRHRLIGNVELWEVDATDRLGSYVTDRTIDFVRHIGYVYCVSVPSGNIVTRYDGRVAITGNCIKHTKAEGFRFKREIELGKAFRKMIVPAEGRVLMEFDKSAFHVVMLGREAQSANYIRLAKADMHSFFASHLLARNPASGVKAIDPSLPDDELRDRCKWIKKNYKGVRDTKAKPTILGVGLGLGYMKLWHENRENIDGPSEAKDLLAIIRSLFPEVFIWQDKVKMEAYQRGILLSEWGSCRTFYDVFQKRKDKITGKWMLKPGTDAEKAIAFRVQADAFGMMRNEMIRLERMMANERFKFINTVHDSLVFEPKRKDIEYCYEIVTRVMNSPCKTLADSVVCPDGLVVTVDASIGDNWSSKTEDNPNGLREFKI